MVTEMGWGDYMVNRKSLLVIACLGVLGMSSCVLEKETWQCINDEQNIGTLHDSNNQASNTLQCRNSKNEGVSCHDNGCGECLNNEIKCENNQKFVCTDGNWGADGDCSEDGCTNGVDKIGNAIKDNNVEKCNHVSCSGDHCGECLDGDSKCEDDTRFLCVDGQWEGEECGNNGAKVSCADNQCGDCLNGENKCVDERKSVCSHGKWEDGGECGICRNDENSKIGMIDGKECDNKVSCHDKECGDCLDDEDRCEGNHKYVCENGKWKENGECSEIGCKNAYRSGVGSIGRIIKNGEVVGECKNNVDDNVSCRDDECGECLDWDDKCTFGIRLVCDNGDWVYWGACGESVCNLWNLSEDGKQLCYNNVWVDCKEWGYMLGSFVCLRNLSSGELYWSKCDDTQKWDIGFDGKLLCMNNDWKMCDKEGDSVCNNNSKLYYCQDGKWSSKSCSNINCEGC